MSDEQEHVVNFPIQIENPLIVFLQKVIMFGIQILAVLMTFVIIWGVIDVGYIVYQKVKNPPFLLLDMEDILGIFGAFLAVLIAIEIFLNIILYLKKEMAHLKLVIATALMAIARKVIIIDYDLIAPAHLYGIASVVLALGISYWFINQVTLLQVKNQSIKD